MATALKPFSCNSNTNQLRAVPSLTRSAKFMVRLPMLSFLALQCFTTTECCCEELAPRDSLRLVVQRDSAINFHRFLEALKLLVTQRGSSLKLTIGLNQNNLSVTSLHGFPGEPVTIHVSRDQVALGSGPSRQPLTVEQLCKRLREFADAASKADSKGAVLLIADRQVPGDFGLKILDAIIDSGIPTVMLSDPDLHCVDVPTTTKKPSSPSARQQEAEQGGAGQPATQSRQAKE